MEIPEIMDIASGVRCHSCEHGEYEEGVSTFTIQHLRIREI